MNTGTKKMSSVSKLGQFARSKMVVGAAVAAASLGMAGTTHAAIATITGLTTSAPVFGTTTSVSNVVGVGAAYSQFQAPNTYTVNYAGEDLAVKTVTAAGKTYSATGLASDVVRRYVGPNNDQLWYDGTGGSGSSVVNLEGPALTGFNQIFDTNNLLVGADNLFSSEGNSVGNNTNVDRVDMIFNNGITASDASAFSILDRGPTDDHDAFQVAAITSINNAGTPLTYGKLVSFERGSYGTTDLVSAQEEVILRTDNNIPSDPLHPSDSTGQVIGGVLIPTSDLVAAGTTIYGYSLFSPDVSDPSNAPATALANWTNGMYYQQADSTSTGGGIDPVAETAVLYTLNPQTSVPEPTSAVMVTLAIGSLLGRRPKRLV